MPLSDAYVRAAHKRAMQRLEEERFRANMYRLLNRFGPAGAAQVAQLMGAYGLHGFTPMHPAIYAQVVAPQQAANVYSTYVDRQLGLDALRTNRYATALGAKRDVDVARMQSWAQAMAGIPQAMATFYGTRPAVQMPASPYEAAANLGMQGYAYQANMAKIAEDMARQRQLEATRNAIIQRLQTETDPEVRQQLVSILMATMQGMGVR